MNKKIIYTLLIGTLTFGSISPTFAARGFTQRLKDAEKASKERRKEIEKKDKIIEKNAEKIQGMETEITQKNQTLGQNTEKIQGMENRVAQLRQVIKERVNEISKSNQTLDELTKENKQLIAGFENQLVKIAKDYAKGNGTVTAQEVLATSDIFFQHLLEKDTNLLKLVETQTDCENSKGGANISESNEKLCRQEIERYINEQAIQILQNS